MLEQSSMIYNLNYTKSTPSFIYFVVRGKLEEKETLRYTPSLRHIDVTQDDLHDLKILLSELESASSFMVRCEQRKVGIFSNDDTWLKHVSKKLHCVSDFYEPANNTADLACLAVPKIVET